MKNLMSVLKVATSNIEVIHRNVYGTDFFNVHDVTREYYKLLSDMTDDVIELGMSIGLVEPSLEEALRFYPGLKPEPFKCTQSFTMVREMFHDIMEEIDAAKETLPHDISDRLQEYKRWLRKEADNKLARVLSDIH
jgi:DNA-binding ferritin-like protein